MKQTNIKNCGHECSLHGTNENKTRQAFFDKHGCYYSAQSKEILEKQKQTKLEIHGDATYNNREKAQKTCMKVYGKKYASCSEKVKLKTIENNVKKYGVNYPIQLPEIRKKGQHKYNYFGIKFDSSIEIAYYIWLKDHNIEFEYQPNIDIVYHLNGEEHHYNPDFLVEGRVIELKGLQFFENKDPSKKMINPYKYKNDTPEIIQYRNDLMEAKHQCMIENGVKIITDFKETINYIKKTYGKDYLNSFKNEE